MDNDDNFKIQLTFIECTLSQLPIVVLKTTAKCGGLKEYFYYFLGFYGLMGLSWG